MPKSDTWPGGVAMESLSNIDSAGSCDSVISMNSGCSEDSMEHLSAEERACLMYLEETIEALEVQEDSGLSNDEDSGLQAEEISRPKVDDISIFKSDEFGRADHHAVNQTSEPQSFPVSAANTKGFISTPLSLTQPKPPDTESVPPSATRTRVLCISTDGDAKPKIVTSTELCSGQSTKASEINLGLIPPPSDFMDVPYPHAQPKKVQDHPPPAEISCNKPGATIDLEKLRQRASAKRTEGTPNMAPPEVPPTQSPPAITSGPQLSPPTEAAEPRGPPAVAPKPKKLPPNIILKSHKAAVAGSDGSSGHSVPASSDRVLMDPQRVRFEALRKLGLLKGDEADSGPALSPKLSPKTRRSWGAPPSPLSPAAPHTPPLTPSNTCVNSPPRASVSLQSPAVSPSANSTAPDILPAPAAFSDPLAPLPSDNELSAVKDVSEAEVDAQVNTPPFTPPTPTKQLMPFKIIGVKSATLERSGLGLSSYMASQDSSEAGKGVSGELSPSHLRNNRPRPASLGSRKEFSSAQGGALQPGHAKGQEPNSRRSMPAHTAFQHSGDSQKLPRSQGISVLICPRAENEEDRREALKKLGLLRD
ncbi:specifically androgen-regulated gene protein-like isoform X1 [Seriola lalandi dorsalis]|uniref:Specifically androgen-regulated gene protein-like n=2 Tax=Seriola lalandi dorsalis TaxID=1841481 RepID=A0A3B4X376_SERLL|nr:specifically androgen-regulated gene protein-like isoform X1 [Seriola lalandi dorsalis]